MAVVLMRVGRIDGYRRAARSTAIGCALLALVSPGCREPAYENVRPQMRMEGTPEPGAGMRLDGGMAPGDATPRPSEGDSGESAPTGGGGGRSSNGGAGNGDQGNAGESGLVGDAGVLLPQPFTKRALLEAAAQCAVAQYSDFESNAGELVAATADLAAQPDAERLQAAQRAFLRAMASWQRAEVFRFGPATRTPDPGALNLRDEIYAFPLVNYCVIDRQLVSEVYASAGFATSLASARGLSALEYLLFHAGADNACPAATSINSDGSWAALSAGQLAQRRADYASAAARDVHARAQALLSAWDPDAGNFMQEFVHAGDGSSVFALDQAALNTLSDALFYVEKEVKDYKLGTPLGLTPECALAPAACPDAVESRYARVSTDHVRQNLIGVRRLFQGCGAEGSGLGFDDWLEAVGSGDLAGDMLTALDGAQAAVDALDPPIEQAIVSEPAKVLTVHAAIKQFTDQLKTTFLSVLDLERPRSVATDND